MDSSEQHGWHVAGSETQETGGIDLLPRTAITSCATIAFAMVFSVQQSQHGALVVYKLKVPPSTVEAGPAGSAKGAKPSLTRFLPARPPANAKSPSAAPGIQRLSPLEPTTLGTVTMPSSWQATPAQGLPQPLQSTSLQPTPLLPISLLPTSPLAANQGPSYRVVSDAPMSAYMVNEETGQALTLDAVKDAVEWRRDTVERLRGVPTVPRF